jgi:inositol-1,3,4-trisphosphate 5/6-kinase/inositol-tetrakisphosphate 1-kinase
MLLNSNKNLINVNKRDLMIEFLLNFCNCAKLKTVQEKYSTEVLVPHCYPVEYKEIYELYQFENFINEKNLTLPLIIKYSGPRTDFNHLLITIITPEGLSNYVEFFKNYAKGFKDEISMVIQSYVNHGGYVIKLYRISDKAVIYLRPSLPDVTEELTKTCEEYSKGYYQIYTNDLVTPEYKKFWMKLSNNDKIKISKNDEFLDKIAKLFEDYSEMSLFGLDFLYDIKENKYYVVDVNYFPGYKELVPEFNDVIIDHVVKYFKIFKENGKIFNI